MTNELKLQIASAAREYMTSKGISQATFSKLCGVSESYMSNILNDVFEYPAGKGKMVTIADMYFERIGRKIGMSLAISYWRTVATPQFTEIIWALETAKEHGSARMIIGETGCGKTYTTNRFIEKKPEATYLITVSSLHRIGDVINDICVAVGIEPAKSKLSSLRGIEKKIKSQQEKGLRPQLIIDETENLSQTMLGAVKAIYDAVKDYCSITMVGTPELLLKLDKLAAKQKPGVAQFRRRFKAGTVSLAKIDRDRNFEEFFEGVDDMELRKLLRGLCSNYGELHDFLEPAMRSAAEDGAVLSDEYFRIMYKIA